MDRDRAGQKRLYIMCGLPFSGKTTLAYRIADYAKCTLIVHDEVYGEIAVKAQLATGRNGWELVSQVCANRMRCELLRGASVVYDTGNLRFEHRETLRQLAVEQNADPIIVFLNVPVEVIHARRDANRVSQARHQVSDENFNDAFDQYEPPHLPESCLEFRPEDNMEAWLKYLDRNQ